MKHFSPYILKAFGALLSIGHLLFALHFLASEDEKVYFRMIAYANIILMIARSSVDFLATFAGAESSVISGRFTIERGFLYIVARGFLLLTFLVGLVLLFGWGDNSTRFLIVLLPIFLYISSVTAEFLKGAGFANTAIFIGDILPSLPVLILIVGYVLDAKFGIDSFVMVYLAGSFLAAVYSCFYLLIFGSLVTTGVVFKGISPSKSMSSLLLSNILSGPGIRHSSIVFMSYLVSGQAFSLFVLTQRMLTQYRMILTVVETVYVRGLLNKIRDLGHFSLDKNYWRIARLSLLISIGACAAVSIASTYILDFAGIYGPGYLVIFIVSNVVFALSGFFVSARKVAFYLLPNRKIIGISIILFVLYFSGQSLFVVFNKTSLTGLWLSSYIFIQGATFLWAAMVARKEIH